MEFTGERMIPEHNKEDIIYSEHILRYNFAKQFVKGKRVLDIACGSGYGTNILAKAGAKYATGIDISKEAAKHAQDTYKRDNLGYQVGNGTNLDIEDNSFDIVVSFETIEHLEEYEQFASELSRVLKKDGLLIISSPNKDLYHTGNEFHFREFSKKEFQEILQPHFSHTKLLMQNNYLVSALFETDSKIPESENALIENFKGEALYFLALCSNTKIPTYNTNNLFASPDEISSTSVVHEREHHIKILKQEIEELKGHINYFKTSTVDKNEHDSLLDQYKHTQSELDKTNNKCDYLYESLQRNEKQHEKLLAHLTENNQTQAQLITSNAKIEEQKANLLAENAAIKKDIETLENNMLRTKAALQSEIEKSEYLFKLKGENEATIEQTKKETRKLTETNNSLAERIEDAEEQLKTAKEEREKSQSELVIAKSLIEKASIENKEALIEIKNKQEKILALTDKLYNTENSLKESCSKNEILSIEKDALEDRLQSLQIQIDRLTHDLSVNLQKLSEQEAFILDLESQNKNQNLLLQHKTDELNTNASTIQNIETQLREMQREISAKENAIALAQSKLSIAKQETADVKKSLSWKITMPLRWIFDLLSQAIKPISILLRDTTYALELLKREGIKPFIFRFFWYLRGKRLIEEIQYTKNKKIFELEAKKANKKSIIHFDKTRSPKVSIIIPVFNQWDYTYNCLNSIYENTKGIEYEIIIADDVSTDETKDIKEYIKNITVVRNKENMRFLLNCNTAAKEAKGEYVLFLNNDTYVHQNWLQKLLSIFENFENVGATGAKLIYEDGRLQEAGGIIWDDASGWNYGRLGDPQQPEFNYVKEVDYISGACLMIPRKLWKELGGFDPTFVPAYYEDTDICFQIRKAGYRVMLQPHSVVTHFEGISNGTDTDSGQKKFQLVNHKKFYSKWKDDLKNFHFKNSEHVFLARERSRNKTRVLVIDHYVPHYDKDAGSRSTFSYLKLLVKMGYNVKFIGDNFYKHEPYTSELEELGIEVLYGNYYCNNISEWIKENGKYFDYVFAHRMHIAPKYFADLKKHSKAKIIYIGHDLQFVKSKKEYELSGHEEFLRNYEKFKEIESSIFKTVDIIYPFSTYEAPIIQDIVPKKIVRAIPVYFFENEYQQKNGFDQRKDILFVGGFGHPPNVDAILWFAKEIFPLVQEKIPDIQLHVVGSKPTKEVEALKSQSINVTGFISDEELQQYYEKCRVSSVPLRIGAGVKGKVLETMYYKLPAVITSVAAEGIPSIEQACKISDNALIFAEELIELYNSKEKWTELSNKGSFLIKKYYSSEHAENILKQDLV